MTTPNEAEWSKNPPKTHAATQIRFRRFLILFFLFIVLVFALGFLAFFASNPPSLQGNPNGEIRILIDRTPNTLDPRQPTDSMARRLLPLIEENHYRLDRISGLDDFRLLPPSAQMPTLRFRVVKDDLTRGVLYARGDADVLYDTLSLAKTHFFQKQGKPILTPEGYHLSYLGFDLRNPILANPEVRRAIRDALPLSLWAQQKYFSLVSPIDSEKTPDSAAIRTRLDRAGFPENPRGARFSLRYLTTPVREGNELAFLVREALKEVGIRVEVIPLETSLFFSRLKRGDFELFGSRVLRPTRLAPVGDLLRTRAPRNYFGYSNSLVDSYLTTHPQATWDELAPFVKQDLPFIPLFVWRHGLVLSPRLGWIHGTPPSDFDDSFRFLTSLQIN